MVQPDLKQITMALMTSVGLNHGLSNIDSLSTKLIEFFEQIKIIIPNEFNIKNSTNLTLIKKVINLTAIKYSKDKGKQERALCLILSCLFAPGLKNETEKKLFKTILKQKFDYDLTNFIEETISNLIKNQILEDRLTINKEQLQKVFFSFNYSILKLKEIKFKNKLKDDRFICRSANESVSYTLWASIRW